MKNHLELYTLAFWSVFFFSCTSSIPLDYSLVSGKFDQTILTNNDDSLTVVLTVSNPITDAPVEYIADLKPDGTFSFTAPVIFPVYANISSSVYNGVVFLNPNNATKFEVSRDSSGFKHVHVIHGKILSDNEVSDLEEASMDVYYAMTSGVNRSEIDILKVSLNDWADSTIMRMNKDLEVLKNNESLSGELKNLLLISIKLSYLQNLLFNYETHQKLAYIAENGNKDFVESDFIPQRPGKSFYSFLVSFDLNNPGNNLLQFYSNNLQSILSAEALNIPSIKEMAIKEWIQKAKAILSELVGFDDGIFYDLLAANAYSKQITKELQPLSNKQMDNIATYFNNKAIVDILLSENEKNKEVAALRLTEKPDVPKEKLLDTIIAKHKGNVVVIDFWATWCGPCLEAMRRFRDTKVELQKKNVVFIYMAEPSSPFNLWKRKVYEEEGEHYYLSKEEWNYIFEQAGFIETPTPSYLFFDKNGVLKNKVVGYPGTEEMRKMIESYM